MTEYVNKWIYYPWLKNNQLDELIHKDDIISIEGLGVVECIGIEDGFLKVRNKNYVVRVNHKGVRQILPTPIFGWNDEVYEIINPFVKGKVEDLFWHHNNAEFLYYLSFDGRKKTKQYKVNELKPFSPLV